MAVLLNYRRITLYEISTTTYKYKAVFSRYFVSSWFFSCSRSKLLTLFDHQIVVSLVLMAISSSVCLFDESTFSLIIPRVLIL
jgi:hypothetical protein